MQRVALIFDNTHRPETTGYYCRRALGELVRAGRLREAEHFLPTELDRIPANRFDLFLCVDDGLDWEIPPHLHPSIWWAIDTHLSFDRCLRKARGADLTFAAQRRGAEELQRAEIESAAWLPLACDPEIHGRQHVPQQFDGAFLGHVFHGERERLLRELQRRVPRSFVGQRYFEEMAATHSASKIVFNRSLADDVNMRVFEALCSGSLLVTNALPEAGQDDLFRDGEQLATYASDEELWEKFAYYLSHDAERERIARAGRAAVLQGHTYRHRMETLLRWVEAAFAPRTTPPPATSAVSRLDGKPRDYFECDRPDVLALIPETARNVLELGCGGGRLGAALKQRQPARVTGIELDPRAAELARTRLDAVVEANIETDAIDFPEAAFDSIVCADVLEHLRDPLTALRKLRRWLAPGGCLVTSLPNVRNHTVIRSLLAGNWTYESAGLLDADHVRFFTRREMEKLLFRAGFEIDELRMVGGEGFSEWIETGRPTEIRVGGLRVETGTQAAAAEFFAYQYLTRSRPRTESVFGKTSIVIVTFNQLDYTRRCLDSLRLVTDEPYELIFVDNASTDGTPEYLRSLEGATVICNSENRGFPAAVNQGIAAATGDNILLLNNDTLLTTGWLRRLLDVLHAESGIGLAGPVSNNVSGEQRIEVGYRHLNELDGFAWDWGRQHRGQRVETDRLVGFCLLCKREVIDAIGLLDERFGIGNFEDDDFCRRARDAGYRAVIAVDAFVHHFGSVSFQGAGVDLGQLLRENQRKYDEKWRREEISPQTPETPPHGRPRPRDAIERTENGLALVPNAVRLSACLIVRDNETTIRPCLESLRPWVDEIVVVDTGSTDATPAICEELGARVFHWPWRDSFAAARNESLDHARGEWIVWVDSDDTLPEACGRRLRELVESALPENVLGYVMQVHCPGADPADVTVVDHVKLIRNRPDLRFEFRIHEQIIPAIRRAGGEVAWTDLCVVHSGSDRSEAGRARKLERDFRLLELERADRPDHPFVLFNLGMTHADARQYPEAIDCLRKCLHVSGPEESHVRKAFALLISALTQSGRHDEAWDAAGEALGRFPDDKELLFRSALLSHHFGRLEEAEQTYLRILNERTDRHFSSVDVGIAGFKARHNLAVVYEELGRGDDAIAQWRAVVAERPDYAAGWRGWGELLVTRNENGELSNFLERISKFPALAGVGHFVRGRKALRDNEIETARREFEAAVDCAPHDLPALHALARWHFERGNPAHAVPVLRNILVLDGGDVSAQKNLQTAMQALTLDHRQFRHASS